MARNGTKTGGRNFKKGQSGNPGGMTKEQAKARHLTKETLKDLLNTLAGATMDDLRMIMDKRDTTALTRMIISGILSADASGDWRQIELVLQRLVGKVKDEVDVNVKPLTIKRRDGSEVILGREE